MLTIAFSLVVLFKLHSLEFTTILVFCRSLRA